MTTLSIHIVAADKPAALELLAQLADRLAMPVVRIDFNLENESAEAVWDNHQNVFADGVVQNV